MGAMANGAGPDGAVPDGHYVDLFILPFASSPKFFFSKCFSMIPLQMLQLQTTVNLFIPWYPRRWWDS